MSPGEVRASASAAERPVSHARAVRVRRDTTVRLRLFCFPHAGAGASVFQGWSSMLPAAIDVCPIQLPGRETRLNEPLPSSLSMIVREVADAVTPYLDKPFALFGHSMGGAIAFEVVRALRGRGQPMPERLFVSACRAPHRRSSLAPLSPLVGTAFLEGVERRYGPLPDVIRTLPEALDLLLPILRADLAIAESYLCDEEPPLECPISAFGGAADPAIHTDDLKEWRRQTTSTFDLSTLPGGHFFITEARGALLRAIASRLDG